MFGINGGEFLVLVVLALVLVGPEAMVRAVRQLREFATTLRDVVRRSQESVAQELGTEVDWRTLDPRRYDPRVIVSDALFGEPDRGQSPSTPAPHRPVTPKPGVPAPVDLDAT